MVWENVVLLNGYILMDLNRVLYLVREDMGKRLYSPPAVQRGPLRAQSRAVGAQTADYLHDLLR